MAHKVESMAYVGLPPWHGLGHNARRGMSAEALRRLAKQDYTVSKRNILMAGIKGNAIPIKDRFALARDTDDQFLSLVGKAYKPVQTETIFNFFHDFAQAAQMEIETCGSLDGGKYVWVLARVKGADFAIAKKDEMRNYLLLLSPFEHGMALIMQWTNIRVVCWNTLCAALGASLRGGKNAFRMPHTKDFRVEKDEAKRVLGITLKQSEEFKEAAEFLAKKKAAKETVDKYFRHLLKEAGDAKKTDRDPLALRKYQEALEKAPGSQLVTAKGTWWGALNAVTFVVDHNQGKTRDSALRNAWLGNQAKLKRLAVQCALEYAK